MADIDARRDLLDPLRQRIFNDLKVAGVGRVFSFARSAARAAVDVLHSYVTSDGQGRTPPRSPGAVVVQPRGDGYGVAFDLAPGDLGVVVAADSGWEQQWKGGASELPPTGQRHTYGAAALIPGGRREGDSQPNAAGSMRVGAEDGSATLDLTRTRAGVPGLAVLSAALPTAGVRLGSSAAALQVALATPTNSAIVAGWTAFNATIQADATVSPALKISIAAASTAAIVAVNAVVIGSAKVVADP